MGTTADKLQNILNAKEAIRSKFNLPEDLPFSQYADNINVGTSPEPDTPDTPDDPDVPTGVNTDFFLCKSFQYEQSYPEYFDLKLEIYTPLNDGSGAGTELLLDLFQVSPYLTEFYRMWSSKEPSVSYQISYDFSRQLWVLKNSEGIVAESSELFEGWPRATYDSDITVEVKKGTVYPAYEGIRTWNGAKIVLTSDGYAVDETSVETMMQFYKSRIVQVGHIYNSDATIEAAWLYKNLEPHGKFICSYVNRNYFSLDKIVVSGMPEAPWVGGTYIDSDWNTQDLPADVAARNPNGEYILTNPDAQYTSSMIWLKEDGCAIMGNPDVPGFVVVPGQDYRRISKGYIQSQYDWENPPDGPSNGYESLVWGHYNGSSTVTLEGAKVAPPIPEPVEQYWEGYKLYQDKNGKWNYESETTRLTYGDYMPVIGRIYDAMPTMEIGNIDFSEDALWSCPRNMVGTAGVDSAENDEWLVTASGHWADYCAWMLFDTNTEGSGWVRSYSSPDTYSWVQWFNKKRPVLVKELEISYGGHADMIYSFFFYGSDDGENWTQIGGEHSIGYEGNIGKVVFPTNNTMYRYHRFRPHNGSYTPIATVIRAFSQITREVPK